MIGMGEIRKRFGKHKASIEGPNPREMDHELIRAEFVKLAAKLDTILPTSSREKSVAFTELETASMWFHKALANEDPLTGRKEDNNGV